MEYFKLRDGNKLPVIALGPGAVVRKEVLPYAHLSSNPIVKIGQKVVNKLIYEKESLVFINNVARGINLGFELIDNSAAYGSSQLVRMAILKSNRRREELFLTTRVSNTAQREHRVRDEFFSTLKAFDTNYVDLLQFHWPVTYIYVETWKEIIKLQQEGYVKTIGVANCNIHHLETLYNETGVMPSLNQFECHPLFTQKELVDYCNEHGIQIEAYTPIARADTRMTRLPLMKRMAEKYKKTIVQIVIRWHIQNGRIPIVGARHKKNQMADLDVFDFNLTDDELKAIDAININSRLRYDPDNCDFSIL